MYDDIVIDGFTIDEPLRLMSRNVEVRVPHSFFTLQQD
jgi:hypothetical protein